MKGTGVYAIRCNVNGKVYVGSAATSIRARWNGHRSQLRLKQHHSKHLQFAWNKYGESAFEFVVLEECAPESCLAREQIWIDEKRAADRAFGYNISSIAGNTTGTKRTAETRLLMSEKKKGISLTEEHCRKLSEAHKGKKFTEAHRKALSTSIMGQKRTEAQCQAIGDAKRGKPLSEAHRKKVSDSLRGRRLSEAHRKAMSEGLKGRKRHFNEAWRKAISESSKGKPKSLEHIRKIVESNRRTRIARLAQTQSAQMDIPFAD
jgi:group I intron endonuclease